MQLNSQPLAQYHTANPKLGSERAGSDYSRHQGHQAPEGNSPIGKCRLTGLLAVLFVLTIPSRLGSTHYKGLVR